MFGKKESIPESSISRVPVYTVHSLPRKYEPIQTVYAKLSNPLTQKKFENHELILDELAMAGAKIGADAVIGLFIHSQGASPALNAYGTAIRYID